MDWDDTYVMAYLLDEDTTRGLNLSSRNRPISGRWCRARCCQPVLAADVWVTRRVRDALLDRLRLQPALLDLYYGHYLALQSAIIEAERVGFYIDQGRARQVNARLSAACDRLAAELRDLADDPQFNVRSLPQVEGRSTKKRCWRRSWGTSCSAPITDAS